MEIDERKIIELSEKVAVIEVDNRNIWKEISRVNDSMGEIRDLMKQQAKNLGQIQDLLNKGRGVGAVLAVFGAIVMVMISAAVTFLLKAAMQ